jgi:hypothetical protein
MTAFVAAGFSLRDERATLKYTQAKACGYYSAIIIVILNGVKDLATA